MSAPTRDPKDRATAAKLGLAVAQARERRSAATDEYEQATRNLTFTKDFNTAQEAIMRDPLETLGPRFMAWLKRNAWGEYSLYAIGPDGLPKYQVDCCRELGCDKSRLSHVVSYYEKRGFVRVEGKVMYPVIAPVFGPPPEKVADARNFSKFLEDWKVAHSCNFEEMEVARATIKRIRKVIVTDYKKWRASQTTAAASLLEIARDKPIDPAGSKPISPFEADKRRKRTTQPGKTAVDGGGQSEDQDNRVAAWQRAGQFLFSEIARMQHAYPKTTFAQVRIDPQNPDHEKLVELILKRLGNWDDEEYLVGYVVWVAAQFKGLGAGIRAQVRAPGTSKGPATLGLLVNWAEDYARVAGNIGEGATA